MAERREQIGVLSRNRGTNLSRRGHSQRRRQCRSLRRVQVQVPAGNPDAERCEGFTRIARRERQAGLDTQDQDEERTAATNAGAWRQTIATSDKEAFASDQREMPVDVMDLKKLTCVVMDGGAPHTVVRPGITLCLFYAEPAWQVASAVADILETYMAFAP